MGQLARVRSPAPWLQPDGQTFYIDLLFYHVRLHCYFAFELKVGAFQPEHAGKLGFYLAAVNRTMRTPVEGPSIGVLLSESRSGPIVELSLENTNQPIGVSTYQVTRELPAPMQKELPSVEDLREVVNKLRSEMETLPREPRRGIKCSVSRETVGSPNPVNFAMGHCKIGTVIC
jgi:YhcG PDDEXK nuclease domain